jgi:cobalt-zinc-cadmium efflux system membrane fusion protein
LEFIEMNARVRQYLSAGLAAVAMGGALLFLVALRQGWVKFDALLGGDKEDAAAEMAEARTSCTLTPEKIKEAGLHETTAQIKTIREQRTVPGSITYDTARHLEVTAPVDSVAVKVLAEPGQMIEEGTPLVVLSSSAVGLARDEVLQREAELALARKEQVWAEEIAANMQELMTLLKQRPKLPELEKEMKDKKLGDFRDKLVGAYSKLNLAELAIESAESLTEQGAVAKRITNERRSARETAAAVFTGACETARFDAIRASDKAKAAAEKAERLLAVSREHLVTLLGPFGDKSEVVGREKLSEFTVRAPLASRVEERHVVNAARMTAGSPLFTLADTRKMRVSAEIHERDWEALKLPPGEDLAIRVPALKEAVYHAKVRYVGSQVSPDTHSVPLVADIDNAQGRFKPGMFVWVEVPLSGGKEGLVVPPGAIMRHEGQAFVFIPEGKNTFRRADVETGLETSTGVEILTGLKAGERVVDQGAFMLKSELLLEREE